MTFSVSLAISPHENFYIHTICFMNFIVALSFLTVTNSAYYISNLKHKHIRKYLIIYNIASIFFATIFMIHMQYALNLTNWNFLTSIPSQTPWFILIAIVPMFHAFYLSKYTKPVLLEFS